MTLPNAITTTAGSKVELRPEADDDEAFLYGLYASTREEELALTGWDQAMRERFLALQFRAQKVSYRERFPDADFCIVEIGGAPAGRIIVNSAPTELRLVDLVLSPVHRQCGIGTALTRKVLECGAATNKPVRLCVLTNSRAIRLYERLGFKPIGGAGFYLEMEWTPAAPGR